MMHSKRLTILQQVGAALIGCSAVLIVLSIDPYSNDLLTNLDLMVRTGQAAVLAFCGVGLYRPMKKRRDEEYLERR